MPIPLVAWWSSALVDSKRISYPQLSLFKGSALGEEDLVYPRSPTMPRRGRGPAPSWEPRTCPPSKLSAVWPAGGVKRAEFRMWV